MGLETHSRSKESAVVLSSDSECNGGRRGGYGMILFNFPPAYSGLLADCLVGMNSLFAQEREEQEVVLGRGGEMFF